MLLAELEKTGVPLDDEAVWQATADALLAECAITKPGQPYVPDMLSSPAGVLNWTMQDMMGFEPSTVQAMPASVLQMLQALTVPQPFTHPAVVRPAPAPGPDVTAVPGSLTAQETAARAYALFREDPRLWIKRQWVREIPEPGFCLGGALWHVQGRPMAGRGMFGSGLVVDQELLRPALYAVDNVTVTDFPERVLPLQDPAKAPGTGTALVRFNDSNGTVLSDVLRVLDKVASA